eukprot:SAG22_NODE_31_length_27697_cov_7.384376_5_plen_114_part_00
MICCLSAAFAGGATVTLAREPAGGGLVFAVQPQLSRHEEWQVQLEQLQVYRANHGDCDVPHRWEENPALGKWVGRQRAARKRLDRSQDSSRITPERVEVLTAMGFEWKQLDHG